MCGRFVTDSNISVIKKVFNVKEVLSDVAPSYNIAPSQDVAIVVKDGVNKLMTCRWGFIPSWSKDESVGYKLINARAETVAVKPMLKAAFDKHRCLIVADGFYEWRKKDKVKTPVYIHHTSGEPLGLAMLYNVWTSPDGRHICTCTIITADSNEMVEPIHNRMPVIIPRDKQEMWLEPDTVDNTALLSLLKPYPPEELELYDVSTKVNSPRYNSVECIRPLEALSLYEKGEFQIIGRVVKKEKRY